MPSVWFWQSIFWHPVCEPQTGQWLPTSDSEMMRTIKENGSQHGDPDGCVMCHGGNLKATEKEEAHRGTSPTLRIASRPKDDMKQQITLYPDRYPSSLNKMPSATMEEINKDPKMAALTYQRQDCQRCHIGVRGREKRGDYRGMGCAACYVLSNRVPGVMLISEWCGGIGRRIGK